MDDPLALIVEDDPVIADIFTAALTRAGYRIEVIMDGQDALDRLPDLTPDLVLLDLHLPRVPGVRVMQAIRADARLTKTRIIIASADATLSQFLRDEADLVLIKPIGFNQLRELAQRMRSELTIK